MDRTQVCYLPCNPVSVPHKSMGFLPVGPAMVKESVHTPAVVSTMSKLSKSSLNWQISGKKYIKHLDIVIPSAPVLPF